MGYLWNSFLYLGKEAIMSNEEQEYVKKLGKSDAVVPKLMADLYGKGYHLYVDNWCTSEKLFRHLEENGTAVCGTAMGHRLTVPKSMKEESLSKGEYTYRRDDNMLMIRLRDKKEIYFLSTIHNTAVSNTNKKNKDGEIVRKLKLVQDYNKNMGGVDRNDALISNYTSVRKSLKWTTKAAFHFIEGDLLNAFILFNKANPGKIRFMHFKFNIIKSIISRSQPSAPSYNLPHVGRHLLQLIPPTAAKSNPQKKCRMCCRKGVRKETRYQCRIFFDHPGLCPAPCFEEYHRE